MAAASGSVSRIHALFTGSLFPLDPFDCALHSVHDHALNLLIPGKPLVYTLVTKWELMHPMATLVTCPGGKLVRFTSLGLEPNQACSFDGRTLQIKTGMEVSFTTVHRMPEVDEVPPPLPFSAGALKDRVSEAGAQLEALQLQKSTELRWRSKGKQVCYLPEEGTGRSSARFATAAYTILSALAAGTPEVALAASAELVGFGQGLTPAGDDFICGLALALRMRATSTHASVRLRSLSVDTWLFGLAARLGMVPSAMASPKELTGMVSKSFLYMASQGRFSLLLVQLARAFSDSTQDLWPIFVHMSEYGHSSGLDSATGFLCGMSTVDRRRN